MDKVNKWVNDLSDEIAKKKINEIISFIEINFKMIRFEIKWNQLMLVLNKTFIMDIAVYKKHISFAIEKYSMDKFKSEFIKNNIATSNLLFKINHSDQINYSLLKKVIDYNIEIKNMQLNFDSKLCFITWKLSTWFVKG